MTNKEQVRLDWKQKVNDFRTSGLSMKKWSVQEGVKVYQLQYWCSKYPIVETDSLPKEGWATVNLNNDKHTIIKSSNLKISIGKCNIEINPGFDSDLLLEVIKVLSEAC